MIEHTSKAGQGEKRKKGRGQSAEKCCKVREQILKPDSVKGDGKWAVCLEFMIRLERNSIFGVLKECLPKCLPKEKKPEDVVRGEFIENSPKSFQFKQGQCQAKKVQVSEQTKILFLDAKRKTTIKMIREK